MNLIIILLLIVIFALISNFLKKYYKFFVLISVLTVISCYFFIANEQDGIGVYSQYDYYSTPSSEEQEEFTEYSQYDRPADPLSALNLTLNGMLSVFKQKRLYYVDIRNYPGYKMYENDSKYNIVKYITKDLHINDDFSLYNYKIYSYFGITPILLFSLPFNLVTNLYLHDGVIAFVLLVLIFLLSLFLFKNLLIELDIKNRFYSLEILSIFLIGIGNYFLHNDCSIYNIEIETSIFLILLSLCMFYLYLKEKNIKKQMFYIFLISTSLALSVGARPHTIFLIPFFLLGIIYGNCYKNKKYILKIILIFFVPCMLYGSLLAVYNYLRFDSIFDFGFNHQMCLTDYKLFGINDFFIAVKQTLFCLPRIDDKMILSLRFLRDQKYGLMCGIVWSCPIILFLFITPYIYKIYKSKTNFILFLNLCFVTIFIEFIYTNIIGTWTRYVDEYLIIMLILSVSFFIFLYNITKNKIIKITLMMIFIMTFVYSLFVNISFVFGDQYLINVFEDRYNIAGFLFGI